jgi:hypothetical protein
MNEAKVRLSSFDHKIFEYHMVSHSPDPPTPRAPAIVQTVNGFFLGVMTGRPQMQCSAPYLVMLGMYGWRPQTLQFRELISSTWIHHDTSILERIWVPNCGPQV